MEGSKYYKLRDCDGDGVPDPTCTYKGNFGAISSANDCQDSWPNGKCSSSESKNTYIYLIPCYFISNLLFVLQPVGTACKRPSSGWCGQEGSKYYKLRDCDGDGVPDPTCSNKGQFGVVSSANNCQDSWPNGTCSST